MQYDSTAAAQLRVFFGDSKDSNTTTAPVDPDRVTVSLGDVFPLLADALSDNKAWLSDFSDEEITVSSDLYDVLMAYHYFHRPSA